MAGTATSRLTFNDVTTNTTPSASLYGRNVAGGGHGGGYKSGIAGAGAAAYASIALTGAAAVRAYGAASGGNGGKYVPGNGGAGGTAADYVSVTSVSTGNASPYAYARVQGGNGGFAGTGMGGAGGTVTGANATATSLTATGGQAKAVLVLGQFGGGGGIGEGSGNYGGAGADVANGTAAATGFNAFAEVVQSGGAGGGGGNGAGGGAGGSSTLTNAVSGATLGGTLSLSQTAKGGIGGAGSGTAAGGAGGSATSSLTFSDTGNTVAASQVTGSSYAQGGSGNAGSNSGGMGGAGNASISLTAFNTVNATAGASGGNYGGTTAAGGNAIATAQAKATGPTATSTATATATGGTGSVQGDATATATAITVDGQVATADTDGTGTSGTVTSTAETSGTGLVSAVSVSVSTQFDTLGQAAAQADYGNLADPGGFGYNGYSNVAYAAALPSGSAASYGGSDSNVIAVFAAPNAKLLGGDVQDATYENYYTPATGTQNYQSTVTYTLNSTNLPGDLYAGLLTSHTTANGFDTLAFSIDVGGVQVVNQNFTSASSAAAYFADNAVDLGAAPASTDLTVAFNFDLVSATYGNGFGVETLFGVACYCSGTRLATPHGDIAVEALREGDLVTTADGAARPVRWIGHRSMECGKHPKPQDAWPVRVSAGSFGEGAPQRDLFLSPDHAVFADGVLIPVKHLINGATIVHEPRDTVTYWHVELDRHDVILAEGLPCESYLDTGNRAMFANGSLVTLHPSFARTADRAWTQDACAPLVEDGAVLAAVQEGLAVRALRIGMPVTAVPSIEIEAAGQVSMVVPAGVGIVRLVSRSDRRGDDRRLLGALVRGLRIDGASVALHDDRLGCGFHQVEVHGVQTVRWTNGSATLTLGRSVHDRMVEIDVAALIAEMPEQRVA